MPYTEDLFTKTLDASAEQIVFSYDVTMGLDALSIKSINSTAATILGTKKVGSLASDAISLAQDDIVTLSKENGLLGNFTLTVPVGAKVVLLGI